MVLSVTNSSGFGGSQQAIVIETTDVNLGGAYFPAEVAIPAGYTQVQIEVFGKGGNGGTALTAPDLRAGGGGSGYVRLLRPTWDIVDSYSAPIGFPHIRLVNSDPNFSVNFNVVPVTGLSKVVSMNSTGGGNASSVANTAGAGGVGNTNIDIDDPRYIERFRANGTAGSLGAGFTCGNGGAGAGGGAGGAGGTESAGFYALGGAGSKPGGGGGGGGVGGGAGSFGFIRITFT